jgi:hypothetical protein
MVDSDSLVVEISYTMTDAAHLLEDGQHVVVVLSGGNTAEEG